MESAFRRRSGGIVGLLLLPRAQWQAIEVDLLRMGFTIADVGHRVSWRVLINLVRYAKQDSALFRAMYGDEGRWSDTEHLLAAAVDSIRMLVWFGTDDAQHNRNRPPPIPRPGDKPRDDNHFGSVSIPVNEFQDWWDAN